MAINRGMDKEDLEHVSETKDRFHELLEDKQGMEKAMAPHSSTLAWKIPWVEEPGGLQSMGSLGVRHD